MDPVPDRARLRFVEASDLDDETIEFDGLAVRTPDGGQLGVVDGAVIDVGTGRPHYLTIDGGGLFHSKPYLIPIGHLALDPDRDGLVVDLPRDRINQLPALDPDAFAKLNAADRERLDDRIASCCCPGERPIAGPARWRHHETPDWWKMRYYLPEGAHEHWEHATRRPTGRDRRPAAPESTPEAIVGREAGETSPHPGGRARPGDVVGVDTGGERTSLGDTAKDENERRRAAEKAAGRQVEADRKRATRD
jgi:hypothetical protein